MWIDVTWGAGGSTADTTLSLCETAMDVTGLDVLMHLTCTNVTIDTTRQVLQRCKDKGLCNILALRGDPPANASEWTATEGGFAHAVDLVRFIRKEFGIEQAVDMCKELVKGGAPGLHLYTLNLEKSATAICEKLGLVDETVKMMKEYPFNRSTGTRGVESTRPIFWAQRTKSYVERTKGWNEFPDGRFGKREETTFKEPSLAPIAEDQAKKLSNEWSFSDEAGLSALFTEFLAPGSNA